MGMKSMKLPTSFGASKSADFNFCNTALNPVYDDQDINVDSEAEADGIESIIRGVHKESRLFFEPSVAKSLKNCSSKETGRLDGVAMSLESKNPYEDFRRSMEEMAAVITKGDWACLEELLAWYLGVNSRNNHAYIIAAFVDLLLKIVNEGHLGDDTNETFSISSSSNSSSSGELILHPQRNSSGSSSSSSPSNSSLI